jgi:ferrous iron transport protein B
MKKLEKKYPLRQKNGTGFPFGNKKKVSFSPKKVLLLGFPNVGKSLLFHHLTGAYVTVSNYPGTTVEVTRGKGKIGGREVEIVDTPGIYTLKGKSPEEKVTLKFLEEEKPALILFVAEAAALPRMLHMLFEVRDYHLPLVLVLNMIDEAQKKGFTFDEAALEKELQIPVVAAVSTRKIGIDKLKNVMKSLLYPSLSLKTLGQGQKVAPSPAAPRANILKRSFQYNPPQGAFSSDISRGNRLHLLLINPWFGYPAAFLLLFFCFYLFLGVFGAGTIVRLLEEKIFMEIITPYSCFLAQKYIRVFYLRELISGEYGLVTMGLRYSLAIVLPIVSIFFLFFGLLEDCGYLPRLSYLLHRPLGYLGLDGRGAAPLVMGFGCGTMAVLVTRLLETPRERFLATFLLSLGIPCSAQMGLLIAILAPYPALLLIWGFTCGLLFTAAGVVLDRLYPGKRSYSCLEFPPLRLPQISAILRKTSARILWYLKEIVPFFLLISLVFQFLIIKDLVAPLEGFLSPLFLNLGLPREAIRVFIFGFLRRDYAAAGLYDLMHQGILTPASALVGSTVLTLFFPCIAQLTVIVKERGIKESLLILLFIALVTYTVGFILHILLSI